MRYLFLLLALTAPLSALGGTAGGTLQGVVQTRDGVPLAGGTAYFFNQANGPAPAPEKYWRVPNVTAPLDDAGAFSVELPPGNYYIGAILRVADNKIIGPPSDGDLFFAGRKTYAVTPAVRNDAGVVKEAELFSSLALNHAETITAIEGVVFDADDRPVPGVIVFVYDDPAMKERPQYVSDRTDSLGAFRVRVPTAGTYFLKVRDLYGGGAPAEGAFMAAYGTGIPVKAGESVKGVRIRGERFVRPIPSQKQQPHRRQ